jgi:heptaprenyl diphosphate synthase/octaprenyl-diphosphate synthase
MRSIDTQTQQHLDTVDALITARVAPNALPIANEALQSDAIAVPRHVVATVLIGIAHLGTADTPRAHHAAAALELIRAGAAMHRRLIEPPHDNHTTPTLLHGPTLMLGDYFYALAASEMAEAPHAQIIAGFSTCVMQLAEAFLVTIPLDTPDIVAAAYAQIDDVESVILQHAIKAGAVCGSIDEQSLPTYHLAQALAHYHALARHIHEAQHEPLRSFGRNALILPLAYALAHNRTHTTHLINNHASAELIEYLAQTGVISACQAHLNRARQQARLLIDTLQPGIGRDMLVTLL